MTDQVNAEAPVLGVACECGSTETRVLETRRGALTVYRRRRCADCLTELVTKEVHADPRELLDARKFMPR